MEHNSSFDSFELQFTPIAQSFLRETAKWAKFLAIVGFIFVGLYVLLALMMFSMGSAMDAASENMDGMGGMGMMGAVGGAAMGVVYLIGALIYFFPILYLYRFAKNTLSALDSNNTEQLTNGLENLKSHYKYMGILMCIILIFIALGMILMFVGVAAMM